jgi:hypothetical protein
MIQNEVDEKKTRSVLASLTVVHRKKRQIARNIWPGAHVVTAGVVEYQVTLRAGSLALWGDLDVQKAAD